MAYAAFGGAALGVPSLLLGYFGPIYFMPENNLGPLLGIFVTGP
jgi:hypothetical protein